MTNKLADVKRWRQRLIRLSCLLLPLTASAAPLPHWLQPLLPTDSQTALWVQDSHSGEVLISHNADVLMLPASTQKLLTAVTAWQVLGEDFRFHTRLFTTGNIKNGVINGDIYLQFSGDPRLTRAQLAQMATKLAATGVQKIAGKVVLVGNNDSQWQAPGWVWDDLGICYAAPVSAFVIDQNCVKAVLLQRDKITQVKPLLPAPISIRSSAYFDPQKQQPFCQLTLQRQPDNHYLLDGCYGGSAPLPLAIAINNPQRYAADIVTAVYQQQFAFNGQISFANTVPASAKLLLDNTSESLSELISEMLLDSDNLIADTLLKQAGQQRFGNTAGFAAGARTVKETLEQLGISMTSSNLVDGSGLSRYNLLSARQLAQLLQQIQTRPSLQWLIGVLPKAGISGTLQYKRPFNHGPLRGSVIAKTGSMSGVQNLAGFLSGDATQDKNRYLFVVLENGLNPQAEKNKRSFMAAVMPALQQQLQTEANTALSQQSSAR